MRTILILLLTLITTSLTTTAQDITGQWYGVLKIQGMQLRLVVNVTKSGNDYRSTMDSPDQGAKDIPVTTTVFENPGFKLEIPAARIEYTGKLKDNEIVGTFKQAGQEFPLNLSRTVIEKEIVTRPQDPKKPYGYYTEDVSFLNTKANILLSGTLTLPKKEGNFPIVILISGSGPQNRDEELLAHKPFLVLADYLTNNGIGVLRYDDRGVGQSKGDFTMATSADFATDVESAITYLKTRKETNKTKIGLVGHSEGGLIAPLVASNSKDVSFIVLLAGPGMRGDKLLLLQQELISKANNISETEIKKSNKLNSKLFKLVVQSKDQQKLKADLTNLLHETLQKDSSGTITNGMSKEEFVSMMITEFTSPWMQYFLKYDPAIVLRKVTCPVLAVNGEKDLQVPPKENLTAIKKALVKGGNKDVTVLDFPNLNHLFQESQTGSPAEYSTIEQTFSPKALDEITKWIRARTK